MLYLRMYRADVPAAILARVPELKRLLGEVLQPLLLPSLQIAASILGVAPEKLRSPIDAGRTIPSSTILVPCTLS